MHTFAAHSSRCAELTLLSIAPKPEEEIHMLMLARAGSQREFSRCNPPNKMFSRCDGMKDEHGAWGCLRLEMRRHKLVLLFFHFSVSRHSHLNPSCNGAVMFHSALLVIGDSLHKESPQLHNRASIKNDKITNVFVPNISPMVLCKTYFRRLNILPPISDPSVTLQLLPVSSCDYSAERQGLTSLTLQMTASSVTFHGRQSAWTAPDEMSNTSLNTRQVIQWSLPPSPSPLYLSLLPSCFHSRPSSLHPPLSSGFGLNHFKYTLCRILFLSVCDSTWQRPFSERSINTTHGIWEKTDYTERKIHQ